jgi:hypothetical protein
LREGSFHIYDTYGKKTGFIFKSSAGARVDVDCSMRSKAVKEPEIAISNGLCGGDEAGM